MNKHAKINNKEIQLEGLLSLEGVLKSVHGSKRISKTPLELTSVVAEKASNAVIEAHKKLNSLSAIFSLHSCREAQKIKNGIIITELGLGFYPMTQTRESEQQRRRRRRRRTTTTTGVLYPLSDADGCDAAPGRRFLSSVAFVSSVVGCPIPAR